MVFVQVKLKQDLPSTTFYNISTFAAFPCLWTSLKLNNRQRKQNRNQNTQQNKKLKSLIKLQTKIHEKSPALLPVLFPATKQNAGKAFSEKKYHSERLKNSLWVGWNRWKKKWLNSAASSFLFTVSFVWHAWQLSFHHHVQIALLLTAKHRTAQSTESTSCFQMLRDLSEKKKIFQQIKFPTTTHRTKFVFVSKRKLSPGSKR